jgi:predicted glycosyltransferase
MSQRRTAETLEENPAAFGEAMQASSNPVGQWLPRPKVWIDLENSPHVPFFLPIIREIERRGCDVVLTARDCFQVCELADLAGLRYRAVGRHYGKNPLAKLMGLGIRVLELAPFVIRQRPALSLSHGSRSLIVLSALLGLPSVTLTDYEHADLRITKWLGSKRKKWIMTPEVIPADTYLKHGMLPGHVLHYPGIKEDVYVPFFRPDPAVEEFLGLGAAEVIVTLRPPATEAHYHNPESERLLTAVFELLRQHSEVKTVLLPRTAHQEAEIRRSEPDLFAQGRVIVPERAVDGLELIWHSDLVISGGGTMNREAAALGIPVYSLFRGKLGAVDRDLARQGKLILLESVQDVRENLRLVRRDRRKEFDPGQMNSLNAIIQQIGMILENRG